MKMGVEPCAIILAYIGMGGGGGRDRTLNANCPRWRANYYLSGRGRVQWRASYYLSGRVRVQWRADYYLSVRGRVRWRANYYLSGRGRFQWRANYYLSGRGRVQRRRIRAALQPKDLHLHQPGENITDPDPELMGCIRIRIVITENYHKKLKVTKHWCKKTCLRSEFSRSVY